MKEALKLKIGEYWCVTQDAGISIEMTSPLWNDSGSFSYAFTVPYSANRHIFNAANLPESNVNLKTFRKSFELYVNGVGLLFGDVVCTSDEIDEDDDSIELQLRAANATFEDAIEGKMLRDLDFGEESMMRKQVRTERVFTPESVLTMLGQFYPPKEILNITNRNYNDSDLYPIKAFINIPVLIMADIEGSKTSLFLPAERINTAPCFFILYVLKKIFEFVDIGIVSNELENIEDFKRLIFINTSCKYIEKSTKKDISGDYQYKISYGGSSGQVFNFTYKGVEWNETLYFSSENLPDVSIGDFISSLKNAFGVRFVAKDNLCSIVLLKSVLRSTDIQDMTILNIYSITKKHNTINDIIVRYANEEGDEFSYANYNNPRVYKDYASILNEWRGLKDTENGNEKLEEDTVLKIARDTGDFFRTKVDKDKYDEPQLFEVAQFLPYKEEGEGIDREEEELSIAFNPIIPTTTNNARLVKGNERVPSKAFFANVEIKIDSWMNIQNLVLIMKDYDYDLVRDGLKALTEYDCGFTLGVVRSTPDISYSQGYAIVRTNADGFGNDGWVKTLSTTEVTNDSVDISGALYDYNGSDEGIGVDPKELISLKIWNNKQNFDPSKLVGEDDKGNVITGAEVYNNNPTGPLPNRGLVPQFLSEYLYFLKNRKTLSIVCELEIAELVNIKWDKYYNIAGYRCLLNKISFDVDNDGIGLVTIEVFCI